jgi:hypothetical protein
MSDSTNNQELLYTNTGDFQYKAIENENETHEITIALNNQIVSIDVDGTTAYQTSITEFVNVPIIYGDCFVYFINKESDTRIACNCYKNFDSDYGAGWGINEGESYTVSIRGYICGSVDNQDDSFYPDPSPEEFSGNVQETHAIAYITASDGDYVLSENPTVAQDTRIIAIDYTTDDIEMYPWGFGTINDMKLSVLSVYTYEFSFTTTDVDGLLRIDNMHMDITMGTTSVYSKDLTYFFVPVKIYGQTTVPVIPKIESIPMVGWSSVKKITLDNFDYKSGGFISPYKARAILTVNGINGLTGYVYTDNSGSTPIQKIKLYSGSSEVSGTITADIYLLTV